MDALRTPDERFTDLPDYPFVPNYVQVDGLNMHYVDEGPKDADPILMLHGEPSWSYLYRFMIPVCVEAGHRVIAPDLIGFGKSDKLRRIGDYSYAKHLGWLKAFVEQLGLERITLVCQDWGAILGLRLAAENEHLFARIACGNGLLPTGDEPFPAVFKVWKAFATYSPWFPIGRIIQSGSRRVLSPAEVAAYDAPFPNRKYKAGTRAFPRLVPDSPDNVASAANRAAWEVLQRWDKPFLTCFSTGDPVTKGGDKRLQERIPGCQGQAHVVLRGGHFLQEDSGPEFAQAVNAMIAANPL